MDREAGTRNRSHTNLLPDVATPSVQFSRLSTLRRLHSGNNESSSLERKVPPPKQYESEYDKLNKYLQNSGNMSRARSQRFTQSQVVTENLAYSRPRSRTELRSPPVTEDLYMDPEEIASLPSSRKTTVCRTKTTPSPAPTTVETFISQNLQPLEEKFQPESAIYGVAQGRGPNLVMELKDMQAAAKIFYEMLHNVGANDPQIADLRTHLRLGENCPFNEVLLHIHSTLRPHVDTITIIDERDEEYIIDFHHDSKDKSKLKERMLLLFAKPGPPSVTYQKVTAKLDSVLDTFCDVVATLRASRNETLTSPFHALTVTRSFTSAPEGEQVANALQSNEIWIKWGTESGLPPLSQIYMMKHPPTYEMRKAAVLSLLAERKEKISRMLSSISSLDALIPPIYGKLDNGSDSWQVTEYSDDTRSFDTHKTQLPQWIEECHKLVTHLRSTNRTHFKFGDHVHSLYSVFLIVIKDITLLDGFYATKDAKPPSPHQIFVGSSTTGVMFGFQGVENCHCKSMEKILFDAQEASNFRCRQDVTLADACLALSWVRSQPRAVLVINSFQEGDMVNLSLNKKKPFHDKMLSLEQHYIGSKKLGPTNDMRYGMNPLGDTAGLSP